MNYPSDKVNGIIQDVLSVCERALDNVKTAQADKEKFRKIAEQANNEKVLLEKVAKIKVATFSREDVDRAVRALADAEILLEDDQEKFAKSLIDNPSRAIDIIETLTKFSTPAPIMGRGYEKKAAESETDSDNLWVKVAEEGAN